MSTNTIPVQPILHYDEFSQMLSKVHTTVTIFTSSVSKSNLLLSTSAFIS